MHKLIIGKKQKSLKTIKMKKMIAIAPTAGILFTASAACQQRSTAGYNRKVFYGSAVRYDMTRICLYFISYSFYHSIHNYN
jgi:hypothetical protein